MRDVLETLLAVDGFSGSRCGCVNPSKPSMIPIRLVDVGKAKTPFKFHPLKLAWKVGLRKTLAWYRESYANYNFSLNPMNAKMATASSGHKE